MSGLRAEQVSGNPFCKHGMNRAYGTCPFCVSEQRDRALVEALERISDNQQRLAELLQVLLDRTP